MEEDKDTDSAFAIERGTSFYPPVPKFQDLEEQSIKYIHILFISFLFVHILKFSLTGSRQREIV